MVGLSIEYSDRYWGGGLLLGCPEPLYIWGLDNSLFALTQEVRCIRCGMRSDRVLVESSSIA